MYAWAHAWHVSVQFANHETCMDAWHIDQQEVSLRTHVTEAPPHEGVDKVSVGIISILITSARRGAPTVEKTTR